jgi:hypothetical protein
MRERRSCFVSSIETAGITDDGRYVSFSSNASNLSPIASAGTEVFVFDRQLDTVKKVSVDFNNGPADARSQQAVISGDGRFTGFESLVSDLVAGDSNGFRDAFVTDWRFSPGDDTINGGSGNDTVTGANGNDTVNGGAGTDHIDFADRSAGATGANTLIMDAGNGYDIIWNFMPGTDSVNLSAFGLAGFTALQALGHDDGLGNHYYALGAAGSDYLYIIGKETADMSAGDFVIV